jgi:presenilin-like A22 family membrane protease|tara:strand:+ start:69 stop:941 length:873 start_codon:yes stop_codon:yes gene_type:complete
MKHNVKITLLLLFIFLFAQFIGLGVIYNYIDPVKSTETGKTEFQDLPLLGERPEVDVGYSWIHIMFIIILGTIIMLALVKYQLTWVWKGWFLIAVLITLLISFAALMRIEIALMLALVLAIWKVFKPNVIVHNLTELFIYGGLAAIFVTWFNLLSASILMILIAIYDAYAVWKSKHMITLAKSQAKAKVFAGLYIPYKLGRKSKKKVKTKKVKVRTALLGGGDIGFPLIFAGVVLKEVGVWQSFIIPIFACLGLAGLLWFSKEKKFYPAMPFISAGCFVGLGVVYLLMLI